jgi:hypothetical protein
VLLGDLLSDFPMLAAGMLVLEEQQGLHGVLKRLQYN